MPVKFEFVKEVVARGVTLRRADLFKKIRNNEPKPEKLSDRSWRSLSKQLESDAMIKKSKICSRANATRANFGRTRPSGEVDVRERLRRKFRQSPEPEEISMEMSRNKGYGGRSKKTLGYGDVMRGSEKDARFGRLVVRVDEPGTGIYNVTTAEEDDSAKHGSFENQLNTESEDYGTGSGGLCRPHVLNMTVEEISQHPLVLKMMERLEALEGRQISSVLLVDGTATEKESTREVNVELEGTT